MESLERALRDQPLSQAWPRAKNPVPIVVIGAGGIVRSAHLPAYARIGLPVLGAFDQKLDVAGALAADFGLPKAFGSLDNALEAGRATGAIFDLAVPADAIEGVLERLPERSAILIQKPFGRDLEEANRLLALCHKKALRAAVNFQLRFSPNVLALRDAIARGLLGQIVDAEVRVNVHTPWHLWDFLRGIPRHEVLYHSIHYLDLLRLLLGEPSGVYSKVTRSPDLPDYSDTRSTTILDYGEQVRAVVSTFHGHDFGTRHAMSQLKLEGTRGVAVLRLGVNLDYPKGQPDSLELALKGEPIWHQVPLRGGWFDHAFEGTMSNLQRYVSGEDDVLVTRVDDATRTMALVEACYRSSRAGSTPIPDLEPLP
jgi:predicted dehydrogenase